jgi:hypothetical protein
MAVRLLSCAILPILELRAKTDLPHGSEIGVYQTSKSSGPEASRSVSKIGYGGKATWDPRL